MHPPEAPDFKPASRAAAVSLARDYLLAAGVEHAGEDARLLAFAACDFDRLALLRAPDVAISEDQALRLAGFLARRANREPASRIVGRKAFWSVDLAVRPGVLDPRADSEAVIRLAQRSFRLREPPSRILDLGSGSGALLCALLSEFPNAFGVAVDISPDALSASAENLAACGFASRSDVVRSDWSRAIDDRFDLVVSNPPYIASTEIGALDLEVRAHDPHLALDGGPDGNDAYRSLFRECPELLTPGGVLVLEFGLGQAGVLREMAEAAQMKESGFELDLGGRPRALAFVRRKQP